MVGNLDFSLFTFHFTEVLSLPSATHYALRPIGEQDVHKQSFGNC